MSMIHAIVGFLIAIGILVVIHEYGHYAIARLFGVKVLRFSIGFGPVLARFRTGTDQTEWAISAIPLGGYVKMLDESTAVEADRHRAIEALPPIKRMAIVAAGPAANFLFAILVSWVIAVVGTREILPRIDAPSTGTPAATAGLVAGDVIVSVDDRTVHTWQDLSMPVISAILSGSVIDLTVERKIEQEIQTRQARVDFRRFDYDPAETDLMGAAGFRIKRPSIEPVVKTVVPDSPAARAGILAGDRIVSLDDSPIADWLTFVEMVRQMPDQQVVIGVLRDHATLSLPVAIARKTVEGEEIGQIGVQPLIVSPIDQITGRVVFGPIDGFFYATRQVADNIGTTLRFLGTMVTGRISSSNLSGPIAIADYAGQSAQMGLDSFFKFLALVSVGLGIINLIPLPPFDGGHLLYYALEAIRGKPLSSRTQMIGQAIGLFFVVILTLLVFYNDIDRYLIGPLE